MELLEREHVISLEMRPAPSTAIAALITNTTRRIAGGVFVDASYEGDLLPLAGVSHRVGREAAGEYNESLGGVYPPYRGSVCHCEVSPWADAQNETLIASVQPGEKGATLAQKLGERQPFIAVFPPERTGQLASFGPTEHRSRSRPRRGGRRCGFEGAGI